MHLFHIPQCTIQNRNVNISVLNGTLWDMEQVHCGIYKIALLCIWHDHAVMEFQDKISIVNPSHKPLFFNFQLIIGLEVELWSTSYQVISKFN